MSIAELHGKLSSTGSNATDRLEDLLTSDVFGAFRYLPPDFGILPLLDHVLSTADSSLQSKGLLTDPSGKTPDDAVDYYFWPTGTIPGISREPDVLIKVAKENARYAFVFEAKYHSGASDRLGFDEIGRGQGNEPQTGASNLDKNQEGLERQGAIFGNQLADQFHELMSPGGYELLPLYARLSRPETKVFLDGVPIENRYLIYLTKHWSPPADVLANCRKQLEERHQGGKLQVSLDFAEKHVLWASWSDVWEVINEQFKANLGQTVDRRSPRLGKTLSTFPYDRIGLDLLLLLERKGFRSFAGFGNLNRLIGDLPESGSFWSWFQTCAEGDADFRCGRFYQRESEE